VLLIVMGVNLIFVNLLVLERYWQSGDREVQTECGRECVAEVVRLRLVEVGGVGAKRQRAGVEVEDLATAGCDRECVAEVVLQEMAKGTGDQVDNAAGVRLEKVEQSRVETVGFEGGKIKGEGWQRVGAKRWLNTALYGEVVEASWQGWMEKPGGSGWVEARLYDMTNARVVDGSLVRLNRVERSSFYSEQLALWRGQNQDVVEARSSDGEEVELTGLKIRLLVQ